jgi:hypothetical protein
MGSFDRRKVLPFSPPSHQSSADDGDHTELLDHYLSLTPARRRKLYVGTGRAAQLCGRAQRTVRFWVECGLVRAFRVGLRKYVVEVESLKKFMHEQEANECEENFDAKNSKHRAHDLAS